MRAAVLFIGFIFSLSSMCIWFYLLYKILVAVDASELMWFFYYAYLPVTIIGVFVGKLSKEE